MHASIKRFLLLFLMLALPMQALASACMLGGAPVVANFEASDISLAVATDAAMAACHAPEAPAPASSQHDCKQCTVCYLASSAILATGHAVAALPPAHPGFPFADTPFIGFIPDGPERPPRSRFA